MTVALLALLLAGVANGAPSFKVENDQFMKDGQPFKIFSGSFHYHRAHPSTWADRLSRMAAMGLNAVQTYVPWNWHERTAKVTDQPIFDFTGDRDIGHFFELAADAGLVVLTRSGPYICGEHDFGGLPAYVLDTPGLTSADDLRTNNTVYLQYVDRWLEQLFAVIKPHLYSNSGNVVMVQIENEYGSYGNTGGNPQDLAYMEHLRDFAYANLGGPNAFQMYTTDGGDVGYMSHGAVPGVFATGDGGCGDTCDDFFAAEDQFNPPGTQAHTDSEYYTGWLTHWGEGMANTSTASTVGGIATLLAYNSSFNLYMAYGGTNWGFWNGANGGGSDFQPVITSYDYDSPISEGGIHGYGPDGDKYQAFKQLLTYWQGAEPPPEPPAPTVTAYGAVQLTEIAGLFDSISILAPKAITQQPAPLSMEQLGLRQGFTNYRTVIPAGSSSKDTDIVLSGLADRAEVYVNGLSMGATYRPDKGAGTITIPGNKIVSGAQLDILVENKGHINYGRGWWDPKGISGATFGGTPIPSGTWSMFPMEFNYADSVGKLSYAPISSNRTGPAFFRGSLTITGTPTDTYLSVCGFHIGTFWVNGRHLGRYWEDKGPQHAFFVPAALLQTGQNEIIIFEQTATNAQATVTFGAIPDFTGAVCSSGKKSVSKKSEEGGSQLSPSQSKPVMVKDSNSACAAPTAGMPLNLQNCSTAPASATTWNFVSVGPASARAGAWQLTGTSLCAVSAVATADMPMVLAPCSGGFTDRSQHFLWFETPGANPQPPSALMALGALPNAVGKCIDVTNGGGVPGQAIGLYGCTGGKNQQWSAGANGGLVSQASGLCMAAC